mgnify:CR=1 FL=1
MNIYENYRGSIWLAIGIILVNCLYISAKPAVALPAKPAVCGAPISKYTDVKKLSPKQLYEMLKLSGFKGEGLKYAWAVAMKETHGNPLAHNFNPKTGDDSYGVFQINLYGALKGRIDAYNLSKASDLKNPVTNAYVAFQMSNGGKNWSAWKGNPGQRDHWLVKQYISQISELT